MKRPLLFLIFLSVAGCGGKREPSRETEVIEPPLEAVARHLERFAVPGVRVSEVERISFIDRESKTGRVSVKCKVERLTPTYRLLRNEEVMDHLKSQGVEDSDFHAYCRSIGKSSWSALPPVYSVVNPAGAWMVEQYELRALFSVGGWSFSEVRPGRQFLGDPPKWYGSIAIDSREMSDIVERIRTVKRENRERADARSGARKARLEEVGRMLDPDSFFHMDDGGDDTAWIVFQVIHPFEAEDDEDNEILSFKAELRLIQGLVTGIGGESRPVRKASIGGFIRHGENGEAEIHASSEWVADGYRASRAVLKDGKVASSLSGEEPVLVKLDEPEQEKEGEPARRDSVYVGSRAGGISIHAFFRNRVGVVVAAEPGELVGPVLKEQVNPRYKKGWFGPDKGEVRIVGVVDAKGSVVASRILRSSHRDFNAPCLEAFGKGRFEPQKYRGAPVGGVVVQTYRF